jgi:mono/diheme cytochrome c family protein
MIQALLAAAALGSGICASGVCVTPQRVITHAAPVVKQHAVVSHQAAYVAPVHTQTVYYAVGPQVQLDSLIQQKLENDPSYQAYKEWMAAQTRGFLQQQAEAARPAPPTPTRRPPRPAPRTPAGRLTVAEACANCHGGATPAAEYFLDGEGTVPASTITAAIRAIANGTMPKDRELTKDEKNQLLAELLSLESEGLQ